MPLFCPLADQVGNAADWAAVVVALVGAIAIFIVSRAANSTAKAVKTIQERESVDRQTVARREAGLLLVHLDPELKQISGHLAYLAGALVVADLEKFLVNQAMRQRLASDISAMNFDLSRALFTRWHVLDDQNALDLARAVSSLETIKVASSEAGQIDLSDTVPGESGEQFLNFRRDHLINAYNVISSGVSAISLMVSRLIESAREERRKLEAGPTAGIAGSGSLT